MQPLQKEISDLVNSSLIPVLIFVTDGGFSNTRRVYRLGFIVEVGRRVGNGVFIVKWRRLRAPDCAKSRDYVIAHAHAATMHARQRGSRSSGYWLYGTAADSQMRQ
jgi:hypothetical protein